LKSSTYSTGVVVESRRVATAWSKPIMYLAMFGNADFLAHVGYVCMSLLSITVSPFFAAVELFALAYRVRIFNEVIHAIVSNPSRLLSTVFLGAIAMWSFMLLGIAFFWNDYSFDSGSQWNEVCDSFKSCFGYHVRVGMNASPAFSQPSPNTGGVIFNFAYTFVILWVIVAIVSGTIIDNLGNLRDMRSRIADDLESSCFICGIQRQLFQEVNENGFDEHVRTQHNIWDYLSFFIHLEETDNFEWTSAEKYVADRLLERTNPDSTIPWYDFFPQRMAMVLRRNVSTRSAMVTSCLDTAGRLEAMAEMLEQMRSEDAAWRRELATSLAALKR